MFSKGLMIFSDAFKAFIKLPDAEFSILENSEESLGALNRFHNAF